VFVLEDQIFFATFVQMIYGTCFESLSPYQSSVELNSTVPSGIPGPVWSSNHGVILHFLYWFSPSFWYL